MTDEDRRKIFKDAWIHSIKSIYYPKYVRGTSLAINMFLTKVSLSLFPENYILDDIDQSSLEKVSAGPNLRAIQSELVNSKVTKFNRFKTQSLDELTISNCGSMVFIMVENPIFIRKLGSKIFNYLYLGEDLLLDSFAGGIVHWNDWKLNKHLNPRLLYWTELVSDKGNKKMHVGDKWARPHGQKDKIVWDDFWSGICH